MYIHRTAVTFYNVNYFSKRKSCSSNYIKFHERFLYYFDNLIIIFLMLLLNIVHVPVTKISIQRIMYISQTDFLNS